MLYNTAWKSSDIWRRISRCLDWRKNWNSKLVCLTKYLKLISFFYASYAFSFELVRAKKRFSDGSIIKKEKMLMPNAFGDADSREIWIVKGYWYGKTNRKNIAWLSWKKLCLDESTGHTDVSQLYPKIFLPKRNYFKYVLFMEPPKEGYLRQRDKCSW